MLHLNVNFRIIIGVQNLKNVKNNCHKNLNNVEFFLQSCTIWNI